MPTVLVALVLWTGNSRAQDRPATFVATDAPPHHEKLWLDAVIHHLLSTPDDKKPRSEALEMIEAMMKRQMGPGQGWFHPSRSRLGWDWLSARFDADRDGEITRKEFQGPARLFDRLDRDHDGVITAGDFDWSQNSMFLRKNAQVQHWFRLLDQNSNGRISLKEWQAAFHKAARGKDHLTPEDLYGFLFPRMPAKVAQKSDEPSPLVLLKGLFAGELGSPYEGPRPGQTAPLFTLPTQDGEGKVSLVDYIGKKPIVLIFGSFT
jgi:hypothetical protein